MGGDLRDRIAEAIDVAFGKDNEDWQGCLSAADAVLAVVQPELDAQVKRSNEALDWTTAEAVKAREERDRALRALASVLYPTPKFMATEWAEARAVLADLGDGTEVGTDG